MMTGTLAEVEKLEKFSEGYRDWIFDWVDPRRKHSILILLLYELEFVWTNDMDENRAEDGIYLRYRYADQAGVEAPESTEDWPCSVLEMLLGLAVRMEDMYLYEPSCGDRTAVWFWMMLDNLGLETFSDKRIKSRGRNVCMKEIGDRVDRWLRRKFDRFGNGSPFPRNDLDGNLEDQRDLEVWYQMTYWVNDNREFLRRIECSG